MRQFIRTTIFIMLFIGTTAFVLYDNYRPTGFIIKGVLVDYMTNQRIKNTVIFTASSSIGEFIEETSSHYEKIKVNKRGEFIGHCFFDKNNPSFWFKLNNYVQINYINCDTLLTLKDTVDFGTIALLKYDSELIEKYYNIPSKEQNNKYYDKANSFPISVLLDKIKLDSNFKMQPSKIDTTFLITRLNYGRDKPRGTIEQTYKEFYLTANFKH